MKQKFIFLSLFFIACIGCRAQMKVLVTTANGVDTYEFNESTKITFNDGDVNFNTSSTSKVYSPRDIKKMTFGSVVKSISLNQTTASMEIGDKITIVATVMPENASCKEVTWTSADENIAMVSASGVVVGLAEGTTTITAEATDGSGVKATCEVQVIPVKVKSITLNYDTYALSEGESIVLEATVLPENAGNKTLNWYSSNEEVVMVGKSGKVIFIANGTAVVTATATDGSGVSASCTFSCTDGMVSIFAITLDDDNMKVYDANGIELSGTKHGVNIIKTTNGTTRKVIKK